MIKPGTLCLLVADHVLAGHFCTVICYPARRRRSFNLKSRTFELTPDNLYEVDLAGPLPGWLPVPPGAELPISVLAYRRHLMPIEPPTEDDRSSTPKKKLDTIPA